MLIVDFLIPRAASDATALPIHYPLLGPPTKLAQQCFGGESRDNRALNAAQRHPLARFADGELASAILLVIEPIFLQQLVPPVLQPIFPPVLCPKVDTRQLITDC